MATPTFSQVTPHIYKLDLSWLGRIPVGVWLVQDEQGWLQVDAGAPSYEKTVMEQVLKQTGGEIPRMLILTHGHADHAAAAWEMRTKWRLLIAAGRAEIPYLIGPDHYNRLPGRFPYRFMQISPMALVGRNVQIPLDDGMRAGPLEVFVTPGHSPGHVALLHRQDRALLAGDVFRTNTRGNKLADPYGMFTYDMALVRESQKRLAGLDFDHLLVSHGPPIMNEGCQRVHAFLKGKVILVDCDENPRAYQT